MKRWFTALRFVFVLSAVLLGGCNVGERAPADLGDDLEGTVSTAMAERLLRDVDLASAPLVVHVGSDDPQRFGADGQHALEEYLREAVTDLDGARIEVVQSVVEEGAPEVRVTLTLKVKQGSDTRFVPVLLEVRRTPRKLVITRARVMTAR